MATLLTLLVLHYVLYSAISYCAEGDYCRHLHFTTPIEDKTLQDHVIRSSDVSDLELCQFKCYLEPNCVSLNLGPIKENSKRSCELCVADINQHPDALVFQEGYLYQGTNNACTHAQCFLNATCQTGFTEKGYRCLCPAGFTGAWCNTQIKEKNDIPVDFEDDDEEGDSDQYGENASASGSGDNTADLKTANPENEI